MLKNEKVVKKNTKPKVFFYIPFSNYNCYFMGSNPILPRFSPDFACQVLNYRILQIFQIRDNPR